MIRTGAGGFDAFSPPVSDVAVPFSCADHVPNPPLPTGALLLVPVPEFCCIPAAVLLTGIQASCPSAAPARTQPLMREIVYKKPAGDSKPPR